MITARYTTDNGRYALTVEGHAGYDEYGKDIVCAAVSALVFALLGWLEDHPEAAEYVDASMDGGANVSCMGDERVGAVFEAIFTGIEMIAYRYPDHVTAIGGDSRE